MPRHRGTFKPGRPEPYELSRGRVEDFIQCPACFWLDRVKGVKFPSIPGFNINSATDLLLKRDFNRYRESQSPHPFMVRNGLEELVPYAHEDLGRWENALHFGASANHFNTVHEETNILFGGGIDDVWQNVETGELHIVDYKSTAQGVMSPKKEPKEINLEGRWKQGYKRQIEMYQWILRRKGFPVNDIGYFVYVDGQHYGVDGMLDEEENQATMEFKATLLTYRGDDSWVDDALQNISTLLYQTHCPDHHAECEHARFVGGVIEAMAQTVDKPGGDQRMAQLISGDLETAADHVAEACQKLKQTLAERNYTESDSELIDFLRVQLQGGEDQLRSIAADTMNRPPNDE